MAQAKPIVSIVDDDDSVRRALTRLVRSLGLSAEAFASATDFLCYGHLDAPGCAILDVRMPGLSGLDLQQRLIEVGLQMPIIFVTAHEDTLMREKAMKSGAFAVLQKPFDDRALLDAIYDALGRERQDRESE